LTADLFQMITPELMEKMRAAGPGKRPGWIVACVLLILAGAAAFLFGMFGNHPERAWQAYLINLVFWIGVSSGGLMFSAVLTMTDARWGRPLKRLAEALGIFLPVACLLLGALYWGRYHLFHWIHNPPPEKASWLNVDFLFMRDGAVMILLTAAALAIVHQSIRTDLSGKADVEIASVRAQKILAPVYGILYAFGLTLLAFDLIMSLDPHWYSTLFGAFYFMGSFYTGLAALVVLLAVGVRSMGMATFVRPVQHLGLGRLLLGFCMITGDFFFTHILIMWYGNLPEETHYILARLRESPWLPLGPVVLVSCYAVPFGVLLVRRVKMMAVPMVLLSIVILAGIWLERMMLIAPATWNGEALPLGIQEVMITAGFGAVVFLCVLLFLYRYPILPLKDPMFLEVMAEFEEQTRADAHP